MSTRLRSCPCPAATSEVVANRPAIGPWEIWGGVWTNFALTGLCAFNGNFMCAEGGGGREMVANRMERGPWETFSFYARETDLPGPGEDLPVYDHIGLQVADGMFVSADGGGGANVYANRGWWAAWETFDIFPAPPEIVRAHPGAWHLSASTSG